MWFRKSEPDPAADKALEEAQKSLSTIKARSTEVKQISSVVRTLREKNHFAEQLQSIMEGS